MRWLRVAIGVAALLGLAMVFGYQHYLAGDFPFQDEMGYVNRLHHLHELGVGHYLFDPYWTYFMPTYFAIWYGFYKFAHLNIEAIRYTAAVISGATGLLLSVLLYRKAQRVDVLTLIVIFGAPFVVCTYNFWANYLQSMEALAEPLIFGSALGLIWIADKIFNEYDRGSQLKDLWGWAALFLVGWLVASGIYPPPLVLLVAIVATRVLLRRRLDVTTIVTGAIAVAVPLIYVLLGRGFGTKFAASSGGFGIAELFSSVGTFISLTGNALFTPLNAHWEWLTWVLGFALVGLQAGCALYTLRLPAQERSRFFVPFAMMLYNALVLLEILSARLHYPGVGFTPRYAIFALGAPVSLMLWFVMLSERVRWRTLFGAAAIVVCAIGVGVSDRQQFEQLPFTRATFSRIRETMMSLNTTPTPSQQASMFVNPPMLPNVYPDVTFLREQHLAMYSGLSGPISASPPEETVSPASGAITITKFGPIVHANTPFHVQPNGESALWLLVDHPLTGEIFVVINGTRLRAFHHDTLIAALVPKSLYSKPGTYPMSVVQVDAGSLSKSNTVDFVVH